MTTVKERKEREASIKMAMDEGKLQGATPKAIPVDEKTKKRLMTVAGVAFSLVPVGAGGFRILELGKKIYKNIAAARKAALKKVEKSPRKTTKENEYDEAFIDKKSRPYQEAVDEQARGVNIGKNILNMLEGGVHPRIVRKYAAGHKVPFPEDAAAKNYLKVVKNKGGKVYATSNKRYAHGGKVSGRKAKYNGR
mgnify:FL=1